MHCTSFVWFAVLSVSGVLSAPQNSAAAPPPAYSSAAVLDEPAKNTINSLVKADRVATYKGATDPMVKADTVAADKDTADPLVKADTVAADKDTAYPLVKADKEKDVADSSFKADTPKDATQPDTPVKSLPEKAVVPPGKDISAPLKLKREKELADLLGKYIDEELNLSSSSFKDGQTKSEETAAPDGTGTGSRYTYSEIVGQFFTNLMQIPLVFLHAFSDAVARLTARRPIPGLPDYAPAAPVSY